MMSEKPQETSSLKRDPILGSTNWSNIWKKTVKNSSSDKPSSPFSSIAPTPTLRVGAHVSQVRKLQAPIEANVTWIKSQGPKFVMLTGHDQGNVSKNYEEASGSSQWETCSDQIEQCIEFIKIQCEHKAVFLVCSGSLGKTIVPQIHHLPQVYAIYVFCMQVDLHKPWAANYPKIRVVSNDDARDLLPQLAFDSAYFNYQFACALIEQGKVDLAKTKLQKALNLLENQTKSRHDQEYETKIREKLSSCA